MEKEFPYCREHGLRLHSNTFVYFNGTGKENSRRARLRNFIVAQDLVAEGVLDSPHKAETHRLGSEMSEDALTWNVFVSLLLTGNLPKAASYLTGRPVDRHVELYLWGRHVTPSGISPEIYPPLVSLRKALEGDIGQFPTEPDILLVLPGRLLICVEAKFASGNPLAVAKDVAQGEKPKDRLRLISRYLAGWTRCAECLNQDQIVDPMHSQLFRNVVFTARMAREAVEDAEWHVVNLVSTTQRARGASVTGYDYGDPTAGVHAYLREPHRSRFTFRSWEGLCEAVVKREPSLDALRTYMANKSAHFAPAFVLR